VKKPVEKPALRKARTIVEGRSFLDRMESGVWGLGIAVLGLLLLLSLLSYWFNSGGGHERAQSNLIGPLGSWLAYGIFAVFGVGGYVIALGALLFGGTLIAQRTSVLRREHLLGTTIILFPLITLCSLVWFDRSDLPQGLFTPFDTPLPSGGGGIVGTMLGRTFESLLAKTGTLFLCLAAVIAGFSIIFRIHVKSFFLVPYRFFRRVMDSARKPKDVEAGAEDREESKSPEGSRPADLEEAPSARVVRPEAGADTNVHRPDPSDPEKDGDSAATSPEKPPSSEEPPVDGEAKAGPDDSPAKDDPAEGTGVAKPVVRQDPAAISEEEFEASDDTGESKEGQIPVARVHRPKKKKKFEMPDVALLDYHPPSAHQVDDDLLRDSARKLEEKLEDFKIDGKVGDIHPGPVIALYEFKPGRGIKISTIASLSKDVAMALAAEQVRIVAPIPGRDVVGFEIPNKIREMVYLRDLLSHSVYKQAKHRLPLVLGKDIAGKPTITDLTKMPHLLVAGTTGSGKSVAVHSFIQSILFRRTPEEVKFIFVDPKMLELTAYSQIPHLLLPVVTEARDAAVALRWAVSEMERRNRLMSAAGVPNITEYNELVKRRVESPGFRATIKKVTKGPDGARQSEIVPTDLDEKPLPYIVVVIDELADLMMVAGKQVESCIARLAQMARAAGIHMIIATQNPTVKVVTGIIKANLPSRIAFKVRTMQDSRVILDQNGADDLLGYGDMLFLGPGTSNPVRIHGAFVATEERNRVVDYMRGQGEPEYNVDIIQALQESTSDDDAPATPGGGGGDDLYSNAVAIAVSKGKISTSALQRELGIGYNKAAVLMSRMEKEGIVGPPEAAGKPRVVLRSR